jgi:hypothetical protein
MFRQSPSQKSVKSFPCLFLGNDKRTISCRGYLIPIVRFAGGRYDLFNKHFIFTHDEPLSTPHRFCANQIVMREPTLSSQRLTRRQATAIRGWSASSA